MRIGVRGEQTGTDGEKCNMPTLENALSWIGV